MGVVLGKRLQKDMDGGGVTFRGREVYQGEASSRVAGQILYIRKPNKSSSILKSKPGTLIDWTDRFSIHFKQKERKFQRELS